MKYKILSANAQTGSINVQYSTDDGTQICTQSLDLTIADGKFQTGVLLDHEILSRGPLEIEKRINEVKLVTNFNEIEALVEQPK